MNVKNLDNAYKLLRPLLFQLDAETAHRLFLYLLARFGHTIAPAYQSNRLAQFRANTYFKNPVGLAAGMDKNAVALDAWEALGFGSVEVGTVTPDPQSGHPRPRIFRLPEDLGLVNQMGFPNDGADAVVNRIRAYRKRKKGNGGRLTIGVNIGMQFNTPVEHATEDHTRCINAVYAEADYITLNVSSPNTKDLRKLQNKEHFEKVLMSIMADRNRLAALDKRKLPKPVLVKVSPDLTTQDLDDMLEVVEKVGAEGIIAANTTLERTGLKSKHRDKKGGASGPFLLPRACRMMRHIRARLPNILTICCGGIQSGDGAVEVVKAGANLVQTYTGLVYQGPGLVMEMIRALEKRQNQLMG